MDKLETFFAYISEQLDEFPQTIEQDCKIVLANKVLAFYQSDEYNGTIDMDKVMHDIYDELLEQKILIISLMFSDGNKIHIEKTNLCNILYFKNIFEHYNANDNVVIELPLPDILDDYKTMYEVIRFIHAGVAAIQVNPDTFYKMALVDDFLGETIYSKCVMRKYTRGDSPDSNTLHTFLKYRTESICRFPYNPEYDWIQKNYFDTVYDLCVLLELGMDRIKIDNSYINNKSGFIGSNLHMNLCENEKNRVDDLFKQYLLTRIVQGDK